LDNFLPQVHADGDGLSSDISSRVRLVKGDVNDPQALKKALVGADCVVHLAAETGTGQSMYEVRRYEQTNIGGSATLYELLAKDPNHHVKRIVVASSRAVYGEGAYRCEKDGIIYPPSRSSAEKRNGKFDPLCPKCGLPCLSMPTPETSPIQGSSFYGLTKQMQEQTAMLFGQVLGIPTFALRYQNVYGPGQSLENPYTGILAIFSNLARIGQRIRVFEDGQESRDFVHVNDVVEATAACVKSPLAGCHVLNVGSNQRTTVLEVASAINAFYGSKSEVEITGAFREGDIRHGLADLARIKELLGWEPRWRFQEGLISFLDWANKSAPSTDGFERSLNELKEKGLLHERG
jgi:dTDP-L-rhamnose 4-epimerase